jgi:putative acetyltransferase
VEIAGGTFDKHPSSKNLQGTPFQNQSERGAFFVQTAGKEAGKRITTYASITEKSFFLCRGYHVIRKQEVMRHGVTLSNYFMEK